MSFQTPHQVLITGAEGVLGSIVAQRFLRAGCEVTGTTRNLPITNEDWGCKVKWLTVDLADASSVRAVFGKARFDAVVHCAGGFRYTEVDSILDEDLDFLLDSNVRSAFYLVRELLPAMKQKGFGRWVFVSSKVTLAPSSAGMGPYAAAKAGINALVSSLAEEVKAHDINVNAVLPTIIDTPTNRKDMPQADFSKWVSPVDLAEIMFLLTQPQFKAMHGALVPVAGRV